MGPMLASWPSRAGYNDTRWESAAATELATEPFPQNAAALVAALLAVLIHIPRVLLALKKEERGLVKGSVISKLGEIALQPF
jgi:hypothetical protein